MHDPDERSEEEVEEGQRIRDEEDDADERRYIDLMDENLEEG